jgi:hypothetical protein
MSDTEYVVYAHQMMKAKDKNSLPETYNIYLCGSLYNPSYTTKLDLAEKFYDLEEVIETADLLAMQAGEIIKSVKRVSKGAVNRGK